MIIASILLYTLLIRPRKHTNELKYFCAVNCFMTLEQRITLEWSFAPESCLLLSVNTCTEGLGCILLFPTFTASQWSNPLCNSQESVFKSPSVITNSIALNYNVGLSSCLLSLHALWKYAMCSPVSTLVIYYSNHILLLMYYNHVCTGCDSTKFIP